MLKQVLKQFASVYFSTNRSLYISRNYTAISTIRTQHKINEEIIIKGWVKSLRKLKENIFLDVNDGSSDKRLQILIPASKKPSNLTTGSSVITKGILNRTPKGELELIANDIQVVGTCVVTDGYPFAPRKIYPPEYVRQYLHFRPRTNKFSSLLRVRDAATSAFHNYFHSHGYFNIHTPILTSNDCEGAGEVFKVLPGNKELLKSMMKENAEPDEAYFNTKAYLTVSGQLHLEAAAHGLSRVYTFGPTFRAENSKSRLHLSEFYMLEAEKAFVTDLEEITSFIEDLTKSVTREVLGKCDKDVAIVCENTDKDYKWLEQSFNTLTFNDAVEILSKNKLDVKAVENDGFSKEHELFLVNYSSGVPTFVINWPQPLKPFYSRECAHDNTKVAAVDLLVPNTGELVGGSLRENNYDVLKRKLPCERTDLNWYLELRKFGGVPTGGFGMGFERYLQFILGINNIKDTIPFPRWPHNCQL